MCWRKGSSSNGMINVEVFMHNEIVDVICTFLCCIELIDVELIFSSYGLCLILMCYDSWVYSL